MTATMTKVTPATLAFARGLFTRGTDAFGAEEISKALKLSKKESDNLSPIPFSEAELTRARKLNQYLIFQTDASADGAPLTMKVLHDRFGNKIGEGKLYYGVDWYAKENFYLKDAPRRGWRLVSREVIPGSTNENYIGQTRAIAAYLKDQVYEGQELPEAYAAAVKEFEDREDELTKLLDKDWKKCAEELAGLKLNQLFRETPVEVVYGLIVQHEVNREYLLSGMYTWTPTRSSVGNLVYVGYFGSAGVYVDGVGPGYSRSRLGVRFSRSAVSDLES